MRTSDIFFNLPMDEIEKREINAGVYYREEHTDGKKIRRIILPYDSYTGLSPQQENHIFLRLIPFLYFRRDENFDNRLLLNSAAISGICDQRQASTVKSDPSSSVIEALRKIAAKGSWGYLDAAHTDVAFGK